MNNSILNGVIVATLSSIFVKSVSGQMSIPDIHFQNAGQIQNYIDKNGQGLGRVCKAETGKVYLRGDNLEPNNNTLYNGTYIKFIGTRDNFAWVQVMKKIDYQVQQTSPHETPLTSYKVIPTQQYGYITARYTCGYGY